MTDTIEDDDGDGDDAEIQVNVVEDMGVVMIANRTNNFVFQLSMEHLEQIYTEVLAAKMEGKVE